LVVRFIGNGQAPKGVSYEDIVSLFASRGVDAVDFEFEFNTGLDVLETTIAMRCRNESDDRPAVIRSA